MPRCPFATCNGPLVFERVNVKGEHDEFLRCVNCGRQYRPWWQPPVVQFEPGHAPRRPLRYLNHGLLWSYKPIELAKILSMPISREAISREKQWRKEEGRR